MKLITKLLLVLLLIGLLLPMWLKDPHGQPIMTPADWTRLPERVAELMGQAGRLVEQIPGPEGGESLLPGSDSPASTEYYRWQDEKGVWHFSDQPPPGSESEPQAEQLPDVANRMEGLDPVDTSAEAPVLPTGTRPSLDSSITPPLPEGVSKEEIEELLQDAHERRMGEHL
jgi:hypothetical protein